MNTRRIVILIRGSYFLMRLVAHENRAVALG